MILVLFLELILLIIDHLKLILNQIQQMQDNFKELILCMYFVNTIC